MTDTAIRAPQRSGRATPTGAAHRACVVRRDRAAEDVVSLTLAAPDGRRLPDWSPGSHVDLVLPGGLTRQYSLCGDRWDAHTYRVAVLRERTGRGGSAFVHDELRVGDVVGIGGPRNNFPLAPAPEYLFVAGGIGITPLLPMVRQAQVLGARWRLLYGGRTRASMAFLNELAGLDEIGGDRVAVVPQDECGHPDLAGFVGRPRPDVRVYACGPAPLLAAVERACAEWPARTLRTERFVAREQVERPDTAFEVELARSGATVTVRPGQSVLDALHGAGADVLSSCGQGTCGTCETVVLAGRPDHRDSILDADEQAAGDSMFVCVSRARTDRLVLDL